MTPNEIISKMTSLEIFLDNALAFIFEKDVNYPLALDNG